MVVSKFPHLVLDYSHRSLGERRRKKKKGEKKKKRKNKREKNTHSTVLTVDYFRDHSKHAAGAKLCFDCLFLYHDLALPNDGWL